MKDRTEAIGDQLLAKNRKERTAAVHRLEFDPETGELVVRRADEPLNPDATTVDQIA